MPTPERTSLDEIVAAGVDLIESGGSARLTMQAVAERVGVRPPSLYKRVRDRDALLLLVAQATADDLARRLEASDGSLAGVAARVPRVRTRSSRGFPADVRVDGARRVARARQRRPCCGSAATSRGSARASRRARLITAWATGFIDMELAGAFQLGGDVDRAFEFGLERLEIGLRA